MSLAVTPEWVEVSTKYFYNFLNRLLIFEINLVLYMAIINFYRVCNIKAIKLY